MPSLADLVSQRLGRFPGLDPQAVLAVAGQEGLGGGVGDQGTSFGPFQLHYGGAYPSFAPRGAQASQAWATSPAGIDYALSQIAGVARGLKGPAAVNAIVSQFERPADISGESARARAAYGSVPTSGSVPGSDLSLPAGLSVPSSQAPPSFNPTPPTDFTQAILGSLGKGANAVMDAITEKASSTPPPSLQSLSSLAPPSLAPPSGAGLSSSQFSPTALGDVKIGDPIPGKFQTSIGGEHDTEGLPGFPARDYFAPAGAPAVAPVSGKVVKLSGHDPTQGPTEGPHGPFGWSVYVQGEDGRIYYMTHLGSRTVSDGETVRAGQPIGTVGDYAKWTGTPDHIHMGIGTTL